MIEPQVAFLFLDAEHWRKIGQEEITRTFETLNSVNTNLAKNVIIFVGDGMSLPTLTASRIYKAQYEGRSQRKEVNGEETLLTFEQFPHAAFSKVTAFFLFFNYANFCSFISFWIFLKQTKQGVFMLLVKFIS